MHRDHVFSGRTTGAILALAFLVAAAAGPAAASPAAKVEPPIGGAPKPLKLPAVNDTTLSNGLTVRLVEDHRFPLVTARMILRSGSTADPAGMPGLAAATIELLREGTTTMSSRQIADELASIGGQLDTQSGYDSVTAQVSALSEFMPRAMSLLADVLQNPSFPESEVALRKQNLKQELALNRSQPAWLAQEQFAREIYGKHPYSVFSTTNAAIDALSRDRIAAFHKERFSPASAILVVIGDFDRAAASREIQAKFGAWKGAPRRDPSFPAPPTRTSRQVILVDRPGSVQSDLRVGGLAVRRNDANYFPSLIMDQILGGGASSRLFLTVREEKGYAYNANTEFTPLLSAGDWAAVASVRTEVTKAALDEVLHQIDRLRSEKVSAKELQDAKNYIIGIFTLQLERSGFFAGLLADQVLYGLPADALETHVAKINAVTLEDVQRAAGSLLDTSKAAIVVVGDGSKIKADLATFGTLAVYDTEGKPGMAAASVTQ